MATAGHQFKEMFLACEKKDRRTIVTNLKRIFHNDSGAESDSDLSYSGLIGLYHMIDECSEEELRNSNVWNSFIDDEESNILQKVVAAGIDIFKVKGAW